MVKLEELDFILFCFESHRKVDALLPDTIAYIDLTFCISGMMTKPPPKVKALMRSMDKNRVRQMERLFFMALPFDGTVLCFCD